MKEKAQIFIVAAIVAFIWAMVLTPIESMAETPSSPAEQAATAQLNQNIATSNTVADDRYALLEKQYQQQKQEYDGLQLQYQARLKDYTTQETQYQQQKAQNDILQQQYQAKLGGSR